MKKPVNLKTWVIQRLRGQSYKWPSRNEALVAARIERGLYKCAHCNGTFKRCEVEIDHIKPVVPLTGWDNWDGFIERLFCNTEGFQILCKTPCHTVKTTAEDTIRAKYNAERKAKDKELKKKNIVDKKKEE